MADFTCITALPHIQLVKKIGEGGMSTVWKGFDTNLNKVVAVKILNHDLAKSDAEIKAFQKEEQLLEEIHHPGIVEAYRHDFANGLWYFTMEYVDGYTFAEYMHRRSHVREEDCLLICESVAAALGYAWNEHGIVHCDLKPENIMINTAGEIKVMDLGISNRYRFSKTGRKATPLHINGTPAYISPEQVYGDRILDCRADIYSLAATLFHMSTGRILFPCLSTEETMRAQCDPNVRARDPRTYRAELSEGFCQLLEAMLVKNRDYRLSTWETISEMCQDIERGYKFKPRRADASSSIKLLSPAS